MSVIERVEILKKHRIKTFKTNDGVGQNTTVLVDEKKPHRMKVWVRMGWIDQRLSWDPAEYGNISQALEFLCLQLYLSA